MLGRGGTTIWERWDGIRPDGSLQDAGHELVQPLRARLDRRLALRRGRRPRAAGRRATRRSSSSPSTGAELSSASSAVKTSYGDGERPSGRRDAAGRLSIDVDVPVNTRAEVHVPLADGQQALESGKPAAEQPGVTYKGTTNGDAVYEVGSGSYRFLAAIVDATSVDAGVVGERARRRSRSTSAARRRSARSRPGVAQDYTADARRPRSPRPPATPRCPSTTRARRRPGHLVNGSFALAQALQVEGKARSRRRGLEQPDAAARAGRRR